MRAFLSIAVVLLSLNGNPSRVTAQCIAEAGNDTFSCTMNFPLQLGGNPTASGGSGNYQFVWTAFQFDAEDYLDNTNSSNPLIINPGYDTIIFFLTVTDDAGSICNDSVVVIFDHWICNLGQCISTISSGDSIQLWFGCITSYLPFTYEWSPPLNISDVNAESPLVWPDSTASYNLSVTDNIGCSVYYPGYCTIYVNPSSTSDFYLNHMLSKVTPNPLGESSILRFENSELKPLQIAIYNSIGIIITELTTTQNEVLIPEAITNSGEYFYRISFAGKTLSTGRFTKN